MSIKMIYCLTRKQGMTREEFQHYWRNIHWVKVKEHAQKIKMYRYSQSHSYDTPINVALSTERGRLEGYDGVMEGWWDDEQEALRTWDMEECRAAFADLLDDESKFIDFSRSPLFMTHEHVLIDRAHD